MLPDRDLDMVSKVCITYDFDGVAPWLNWYNTPSKHAHGVYSADVAVPRLLKLHDELDIDATWFIPGQTIESFPDRCEQVVAAGHSVQHHGWAHSPPRSFDSRKQEQQDFEKGIRSIEALTGEKPTGYRTPGGDYSPHTIELLEELGFVWDSSDYAADFTPYLLEKNWSVDEEGVYHRGNESDLVEVPLPWYRDDWLQLLPVGSSTAYLDERSVFQRWNDELNWMREHIDDGVYVLLLHPLCSGRGLMLPHLTSFLKSIKNYDDTRFATIGEVVSEYQ
jgi:peptidoglycan/xylan/chitin deacetylase (PgdA/CDA1 family)